MAAVPSIGRAARLGRESAVGADVTRSMYERFAGQIYGYCLHQLGSREEAEDAVQTTFMNAFRGLQRGIIPKVESAWLFKIAHNVCLSRRRSSWRRGRVESPNNMEVLQEVVPAREADGDELMRLQDVLEGMPETQRRAILLREWQGLSYREIADELNVSQGAVETLIFRARRTLAAGLEEAPLVEERSWRKRAQHGIDAGGLLAALKALFATASTAKVAATAAAVATVVTATLAHDHPALRPTHSTKPRRADAPTATPVVTNAPTKHLIRATPPLKGPMPSRKAVIRRAAPVHHARPRPAAPPPAAAALPPAHESVAAAPARHAVVAAPASRGHDQHAKPAESHKATPLAPASEPAQHGQATAPGQQKKADQPPPSDHGNGNGHK